MSFEDAYQRGIERAEREHAAAKGEEVVQLDAYTTQIASLDAWDAGLCVIRAATDRTKRPLGEWESYQHQRPTRDQVAEWFETHPAMGIVCGAVSGNLEMFELEGRAGNILQDFKDRLREAGLYDEWTRIVHGYSERTPSNGIHVLWRCDDIEGNQKLARRANGDGEIEVLVETRGEGGFVITAPTTGEAHPSGNAWARLLGGFETIATISPETRQRIFDVARSFDELPDSEPERIKPIGEPSDGGTLPGFNLSHEEVLQAAGFEFHHTDRHGNQHWTRPGKEPREGSSLTVWADDGRATPWSTSLNMPGEFVTGKRLLTPWQLHVALNHAGQFDQAAWEWTESAPSVTVLSPNSLNSPSHTPQWPVLHNDALHGPIGDAVELLDPHTEADPAAVLATLLTGWGAAVNSGPHALAGHVQHPARLSAVIVGRTSKARKGTSWATAKLILDHVDERFMLTRVIGGFGSGESVVDEVRDSDPDDEEDRGAPDKRLLIHEPEFARVLKVCARETSVLSTIIRDAWDGSMLQSRARTRKAIATGHHIAMVGHITAPELQRNLNETEIAAGFANRILWICAERSKLLPFNTSLNEETARNIRMILSRAMEAARGRSHITFTPDAHDHWYDLYHQMAQDDPGGLLGAIVARPEPQCLRLALIYALLDQSEGITPAHINAAWALWSYSRASAEYIWGDAIGDQIADTLLTAIRKAGPEGLDLTAQSAHFARKVPAKRLAIARDQLEARGLIETLEVKTEGRPRTISRMKAK